MPKKKAVQDLHVYRNSGLKCVSAMVNSSGSLISALGQGTDILRASTDVRFTAESRHHFG